MTVVPYVPSGSIIVLTIFLETAGTEVLSLVFTAMVRAIGSEPIHSLILSSARQMS
jgi:hypothetical protein